MPPIPMLPDVYEPIPNIDRGRIPADQMPALLHIEGRLAELRLYERQLLLAVCLNEYSVIGGLNFT
jgi:hypothetical protein